MLKYRLPSTLTWNNSIDKTHLILILHDSKSSTIYQFHLLQQSLPQPPITTQLEALLHPLSLGHNYKIMNHLLQLSPILVDMFTHPNEKMQPAKEGGKCSKPNTSDHASKTPITHQDMHQTIFISHSLLFQSHLSIIPLSHNLLDYPRS